MTDLHKHVQVCECGAIVWAWMSSNDVQADGDILARRHFECDDCGECWICEARYRDDRVDAVWEYHEETFLPFLDENDTQELD
jgi:hypothetical protein